MSTLQTIKDNYLDARKARAKEVVGCLGTLLGDIETAQKRGDKVDDGFVVRLVKKYIENAKAMSNTFEVDLLGSFLPFQLTEEEVRNYFVGYLEVQPEANMGDLMQALKADFEGQYDGKVASSIASELLK